MKSDFLELIKDRLFSSTAFIPVLGSLVLILVLSVTLGLVSQNQDTRQHAAEPIPTVTQQGPIMSTLDDSTGSTMMKCEDYEGAFCFDPAKDGAAICTGDYTPASGVSCPLAGDSCCFKKGLDANNGTCAAHGGTCQYPNATACKSDNAGDCLTIDATCLDTSGNPTGNPCLSINIAGTTPTVTPSITPAQNCSIAKDGKQYCCPTGAVLCGQTTDTMCPLCVNGQTCAQDVQYSEATCTAAFSSGPGCDPSGDQAATDASCSTSTKGCTNPGQSFEKWVCQANSTGSGGHCASSCL